MSTRNNIMVIDRKHSSKFEEGFAVSPYNVADKAYVNMYHHHDGYPEWQGVQIANWLLAKSNGCQDGERLTAKLVHDMYYNSCYLQKINHFQSDIEYIYVMEYTDFTNGETRLNMRDKKDGLYHARKLVDILTQEN